MPLPTNYTFSGDNFRIKSSVGGEYIDSIPFAIVQWTHPYEPRYRPLNEWTQTNLTMVNWVGNYSSVSPGQTMFSSTPVTVTDPGALYIYIDLYNASNNVPSMNGQAWLGQITDVLTLPGGDVNINLNSANIRPMMGELVGNTLVTQDFNSWTPQAVPEPSYAPLACLLFVAAIFLRRKT